MDFAVAILDLAAGKRHRRPIGATSRELRRRRIRAILARTARSRRELDAYIADAPKMAIYDRMPVTYSLGDWCAPPPKPAPKKMVPAWKRRFLLRHDTAPDENVVHEAGGPGRADGEAERKEDSRGSESTPQDLQAA